MKQVIDLYKRPNLKFGGNKKSKGDFLQKFENENFQPEAEALIVKRMQAYC